MLLCVYVHDCVWKKYTYEERGQWCEHGDGDCGDEHNIVDEKEGGDKGVSEKWGSRIGLKMI